MNNINFLDLAANIGDTLVDIYESSIPKYKIKTITRNNKLVVVENKDGEESDKKVILELDPNTNIIGDSAFFQKTNLIGNLFLPNSIESIGTFAFVACTGLTGKLIIPKNLKKISKFSFYGCSGFDELVLNDGLVYINGAAFQGCSNLSNELILPQSLRFIESGAFKDCTRLSGTLNIPGSVEILNTYTFKNCESLNKLVLNEGLRCIRDSVFHNCVNLKGDVVIPKSICSIGNNSFYNCRNIDRILMPKVNNDGDNIVLGSKWLSGCDATVEFY